MRTILERLAKVFTFHRADQFGLKGHIIIDDSYTGKDVFRTLYIWGTDEEAEVPPKLSYRNKLSGAVSVDLPAKEGLFITGKLTDVKVEEGVTVIGYLE